MDEKESLIWIGALPLQIRSPPPPLRKALAAHSPTGQRQHFSFVSFTFPPVDISQSRSFLYKKKFFFQKNFSFQIQ
jgi:hypothetical protein